MKRTPDVFHELDKEIANYIGNPYCEIAIIARQATDLPRSSAFDHGCFTSRTVSYGILNTFQSLTVLTPFYYVYHVIFTFLMQNLK